MALDKNTVAVGSELPTLTKPAITRDTLKVYGPAAGDPNPMHVDDEFVKNAGYPGVFAHGMLSMGYLGEFLHKAAGGVANVRKFRARFAKLTWPGDVVSCKGTVTAVRDEAGKKLVDCDIWTETQSGEKKVVGTATLAL
jgi:acyl dehydratase